VILLGEVFLLLFGYYSRASVDSAFHDGLSRGLAEYGKDYDRTAAIDDIQSTVRFDSSQICERAPFFKLCTYN
jgi:hypothetical protein